MRSSAGDATPLVDQVDTIEARNVGGKVGDTEAKTVSQAPASSRQDAESSNLRGNQAEPHQRILGRFQVLPLPQVRFVHALVDGDGEPSSTARRGDDVPQAVPDPVALGSVLVADQEDDGEAVGEHAHEGLSS